MFSLFDAHCDTIYAMLVSDNGINSQQLRVSLKKSKKLTRYAQFFAVWSPLSFFEDENCFYRSICKLNDEISKHNTEIALCRSSEEAEAAFSAGKAAAFTSVEGAHILDCSLERLQEAYRYGVRSINFTWNNANPLSGSCREERERGLSRLGREFAYCCESSGIIIDASHLSDTGFWDLCEVINVPVIASHSNSRTVCPNERNLTDDQFREIMRRGGVAGLNLHSPFIGGDGSIEELKRHVLHFLMMGGEKNISIGADFDYSSDMCPDIYGIDDVNRLYKALLDAGICEDILDGIFFSNLMRVVHEVCDM